MGLALAPPHIFLFVYVCLFAAELTRLSAALELAYWKAALEPTCQLDHDVTDLLECTDRLSCKLGYRTHLYHQSAEALQAVKRGC